MLITGGDIDSNHRTSVKELICKRILFSHRKYYDLKNKITIKRKENTKQVKYMRLKTNNTSCILILLIEEYI